MAQETSCSLYKRGAFLLGSVAIVTLFYFIKPLPAGDAFEYFTMLQGWFNHYSPDFQPDDALPVNSLKAEHNLLFMPPDGGFWPTKSGMSFCWHFWLYPLFGVPVKCFLHVIGGNELPALQMTNACLLMLALYCVLFNCQAGIGYRLTLLGLASISPVLWYLRWTSPEAFTWSFVILSLVNLKNKRYVGATLCASIASMQNPPVLFWAWFIVLLPLRERSLRLALATSVGASLTLIPSLFYYSFYGVPNLIIEHGGSDPRLISLGRTLSFLLDWDQGMLPYLPLLLVLALLALCRILRDRRLAGLGAVATILVMILACETTTVWNCGASGMMRYAVWMVPLFAWLVVEFVPLTAWAGALVATAVVVQGMVILQHNGRPDEQQHTRIANFFLTMAPRLYNPEPQIFFVRTTAGESFNGGPFLPLAYVTKSWRVTKVLTDSAHLDRMAWKYDVDSDYLNKVKKRYYDCQGLFYLHPRKGQVKVRPTPSARDFQANVSLYASNVPTKVAVPRLPVQLTIGNEGETPFLADECNNRSPICIYYLTFTKEGVIDRPSGRIGLPDILTPGGRFTEQITLPLPQAKGDYIMEVIPVLEGVVLGKRGARLGLCIKDDGHELYHAEISGPQETTGNFLTDLRDSDELDPDTVFQQLVVQKVDVVRHALFLRLDEFATERLSSAERKKKLVPKLLELQGDQDPSLRAAAEWLLQKWSGLDATNTKAASEKSKPQ